MIPVLDYASSIWDFKRVQLIDNIQIELYNNLWGFTVLRQHWLYMETLDGNLANSAGGKYDPILE